MKMKVLNDKFLQLSLEKRAILYSLTNGTSDEVSVPVKTTIKVRHSFRKKNSIRVNYPDGRVLYETIEEVVIIVRHNLNEDPLPQIVWDKISLTDSQKELSQKYINYIKKINNETTN